jgi:L-asparagine oxygenase
VLIPDELRNNGYAFLPAHLPGNQTEEIIHSIGAVLRLGAGAGMHRLKPTLAEETTPNTYSGMYGHGRFPFHTDLAHWRHPPRFLLLRCVVGFEQVPTLLIDGASLIENVGRNVVTRALVSPRRPIKGALPLLRLFDQHQGDQGMLRWDEVFIRPASRSGEFGVLKFRECLNLSTPKMVSLAKRGDTLIIDNWRVLHGRSPVPSKCRNRVLERAYLEAVF